MSKTSVISNQLPSKRPSTTAAGSNPGAAPPGTSVIDALFFDGDQQ